MPIVYRKDIRPRFHGWVTEGFTRYETHDATAAALELADAMLDYKAPGDFGYQLAIQRIMSELKAHNVTARDVLIRVAELVAFMEASPGRLKSQREEDFMLARNVIHLMPWSHRGRRHGAKVMQHLGPLVRDYCYPWALSFVRRLNRDMERKGALQRRAMDYGDE